MKKIIQILVLIFCVGGFDGLLAIEAEAASVYSADPRVAKILGELKVEYKVDKDGDYEVTYGVEKNRSQTARVVSKTDQIYGMEMRCVLSLAAVSKTRFSQEITDQILDENMKYASFYAVSKIAKDYALFNIIYIPADADSKTLNAAISSVVTQADSMEEKLMKQDKF